MSIDWFRDLIICITGLVTTVVLIFIAVLFYSLYKRTKTILDAMQAGGVYHDDSQIDDLRIMRAHVEKPGRIHAQIMPLETTYAK